MNGFKYYVLFIDHFTRFTWIYLLQSKSEVFDKFVHFKILVENQFSIKIKTFRFDAGGEYTSTIFKSCLSQNGIIHQISCPYTQQNGLVERKHRHHIKTTITLLSQASISTAYWSYVVQPIVNLINLLPTSVINFHSPWQKLYNSQPDFSHLKVFGCACYPYLKSYTSHKLEPRSKECLFLRYSTLSKGYLCLDIVTKQLYTSSHVIFNESKFLFPPLLLLYLHPHLQYHPQCLIPCGSPISFIFTPLISLLYLVLTPLPLPLPKLISLPFHLSLKVLPIPLN